MFFAGDELAALQYPPVIEQVKKRCRWLLQFSQGPLREHQGDDDPMHGATVDANALGVWEVAGVVGQHACSGLWECLQWFVGMLAVFCTCVCA